MAKQTTKTKHVIVRVTPKIKQDFNNLASKLGKTESQLLFDIITNMVDVNNDTCKQLWSDK